MGTFDDQRRARRDEARNGVRALVLAAAHGDDIDFDRLDQLLTTAVLTMEQFSSAVKAVEEQLKAESAHGTAEEIRAKIVVANDQMRENRSERSSMDDEYRRQHGNPPPTWKIAPGMSNMDGVPYPAGEPFIALDDAINRDERLVWSLGRKLDALAKATRLAEEALRFERNLDVA